MRILSLCDGMSCGHIALDKAGVFVEDYFAAEIKPEAIKVTRYNYPDTTFIGDVTKVHYHDGTLYWEGGEKEIAFDLVMFGSPCQSFSKDMKKEKRIGLDDPIRSGLFYECYRILQEVNPRFFFLENVASMSSENQKILSDYMGVEPIRINASLFGAALRDRLYWTNIPVSPLPEDKGILLQDILTSGYTDRQKARCLLVSDSRPLASKEKMLARYRKGFTTIVWEDPNDDNSIRYLNQLELERCHQIPEGYTKCLSRNEAANVIGDGWAIDVITHIFKGLN